ncbi:hypothetical protein JR316_0008746 [Psilocybe cubensis]|uniref:Uncharacterized protein n=2 Tax=Psilocybe cubensis TaxID=181762 RepID=A0A8H7XYT1_PSICU|nr:hypothetical protein JR316_0008746 [Psilocybe cubensis]KAH9478293.1 hypothetical protein JR316_0008746 [Psilocybe cubensis]
MQNSCFVINRANIWIPGDMDMYVKHRYALPVLSWMMSIGFTIMPHPKYPDNTTAEKILKMEKIVLQKHPLHRHYNTTGVVVNLWCQGSFVQLITTCQSVVECILGYHSTGVMNFVTFEKVYSLYPNATFGHQVSLLQPSADLKRAQKFLAKYHSRGLKFVLSIPSQTLKMDRHIQSRIQSIRDNVNVGYSSSRGHVLVVLDYDPDPELFSPGIRRVGDRHCWVYSLPLLPKANQTSFVEANSWALLLNEFDCLHFGVRRISGIALDFHYTAADVYQLHKRVKKAIKSWERGIRQKDDRVHATVLYLLSRKADIFWLHRPQPQSLLWNGYL